MNCEEVAKHLTEYLDKTLDTAMTTRVATHIISCALCRTESNELADCIQQVATLPAMDPPLGFAQRVMAHVRDSDPKPSLWQRLMVLVSSTTPIRATAIAAVAIFAVVLYQKEQPLNHNSDVNLAMRNDAHAPIREQEPPAASATTTGPTKTASETAKKAVAETSPSASSSSPAEAPPQIQPAALVPLKAEKESAVVEKNQAPRRPPLRVQEVTTARDSGSMLGDARGFSAQLPASLGALRQSAPLALERSMPLGDRVADFEFVVRRRSPQRHDAIENLGVPDGLQKSSEADNLSSATSRPTVPPPAARARIESIAEIRFYNVAPEHFEIFKKELAIEAIVESEPKLAAKEIDSAKQADRQLLVKVTILPADRTTPSR